MALHRFGECSLCPWPSPDPDWLADQWLCTALESAACGPPLRARVSQEHQWLCTALESAATPQLRIVRDDDAGINCSAPPWRVQPLPCVDSSLGLPAHQWLCTALESAAASPSVISSANTARINGSAPP